MKSSARISKYKFYEFRGLALEAAFIREHPAFALFDTLADDILDQIATRLNPVERDAIHAVWPLSPLGRPLPAEMSPAELLELAAVHCSNRQLECVMGKLDLSTVAITHKAAEYRVRRHHPNRLMESLGQRPTFERDVDTWLDHLAVTIFRTGGECMIICEDDRSRDAIFEAVRDIVHETTDGRYVFYIYDVLYSLIECDDDAALRYVVNYSDKTNINLYEVTAKCGSIKCFEYLHNNKDYIAHLFWQELLEVAVRYEQGAFVAHLATKYCNNVSGIRRLARVVTCALESARETTILRKVIWPLLTDDLRRGIGQDISSSIYVSILRISIPTLVLDALNFIEEYVIPLQHVERDVVNQIIRMVRDNPTGAQVCKWLRERGVAVVAGLEV